jgi:hypothetical protein
LTPVVSSAADEFTSARQVLEMSDGLVEELGDMVVEERIVDVPTGATPADKAEVPRSRRWFDTVV